LGFDLLGDWLRGTERLTAGTQKHEEVPVHWHICDNNNSVLGKLEAVGAGLS